MNAVNEESSRDAATLSAELELLVVEAGILPVAWCNGFAASGKSLAKLAESVEAAVRKECAEKCRLSASPSPMQQLGTACPACGNIDTEWHCTQITNSGVSDGRLRMSDVTTMFFLGCNSCSETIHTMSGGDVARLMTGAHNDRIEGSPWRGAGLTPNA